MMKVFEIDADERRRIIDIISGELSRRDEIVLAYIHGSFLEDRFRDIDIAIYLEGEGDIFHEIRMERELEELLRLPVDIRILNDAPLSFRFSVIKNGELLFSKDERRRVDFECLTMSMYHDFSFHRDAYRRAIGLDV